MAVDVNDEVVDSEQGKNIKDCFFLSLKLPQWDIDAWIHDWVGTCDVA